MKTRTISAVAAILITTAVACSDSKSGTTNPVTPTPPPAAPAPTPSPSPAPTPQKVVLIGTVYEVAPNRQPVADARVEVASGPEAGRYIPTDATGAYRLVDLTPGTITVVVRKTGYQLWQITNLSVATDQRQDVNLFPTPPTNAAGATATARCNDGTWSWAQTRAEACTANGGFAYGVCPGALCDPQ